MKTMRNASTKRNYRFRAAAPFAATLALMTLSSGAFAQFFTQGDLVVSRIGDGGAALSSTSAAVFLDEYGTTGTFVHSQPLPTAASNGNQAVTSSGSATSEGALTLSSDGQYLTYIGYGAAPGTANVSGTTSASVNRVIARVGADGVVNSTTALNNAFSGSSPRSVVSTDGVNFWAAGGGGGVQYATLGSATSTALNTTTPTNLRNINIFNGQLYTSTGATPGSGVYAVGTGLPTTAGQTLTPTITTVGSGTGTASPYDYFFADANTVYIADDRVIASGGGLQKWVKSGSTFTLAYTLSTNLTAGLRGLTGTISADGVATLYAVTADATNNKLVGISDLGAASSFITLATAGTNTVFRGVDFAPKSGSAATPSPSALLPFVLGLPLLGAKLRNRRKAANR